MAAARRRGEILAQSCPFPPLVPSLSRSAAVEAKLGGAGDRFGDYLCVDCANLPCIINWQTQNSSDLSPKFRSLFVSRPSQQREGKGVRVFALIKSPDLLWHLSVLMDVTSSRCRNDAEKERWGRGERKKNQNCNSVLSKWQLAAAGVDRYRWAWRGWWQAWWLFMCGLCQFVLCKWRQLVYKPIFHQSFHKKFEAHIPLTRRIPVWL